MFKDITLGQYYPVESPVHRLDPRVKILLTIAFIVGVFLAKSLLGFLPVIAFIVLAAYASHLPLKLLAKGLKPLRFILIFTFLLNLFFSPGDTVLVHVWRIQITLEGLLTALRFSALSGDGRQPADANHPARGADRRSGAAAQPLCQDRLSRPRAGHDDDHRPALHPHPAGGGR